MPSVLWLCWLGVRKSIRPVKIWLMRCWRGYLLQRSANDLMMPLPPHHVCFSEMQNGLSFWHRLTRVVPDKGSSNGCSSSSSSMQTSPFCSVRRQTRLRRYTHTTSRRRIQDLGKEFITQSEEGSSTRNDLTCLKTRTTWQTQRSSESSWKLTL